MTLPLTEKQEKLWSYIKSCERSPSFVEMRDALGLASKSSIHRLIAALEERGYVYRIHGRARTIIAIGQPEAPIKRPSAWPEVVYIPLHGRIS